MILKTMWQRYTILVYLKNKLVDKGYNFKYLSYLNSQLEILEILIKKESNNVLRQLIFEKTNIRLFEKIEKGEENLVDIYDHREQWQLCRIEENNDGWSSKYSLIFSTEESGLFVFNKNNCGQKYISNKWQ